ncbi:Acyl-coenzyme A thioesterase 1 [Armadillidium nasatum]|uniref:Acyl-coenzyme A thioesterase 1 n=1 Tax=Armadillidium nasatum TaxID=96803 RepID=A0A5N5SYJ3_9CRUS|nr:Acyl-coenzyme A thioesterase 1 [Armadillidium nasatum]
MKGNLLQVNPQKCLQDEPVCIIIANLPPGSDITLASHFHDKVTSKTFFTYAHFRANHIGKIDLSTDGSMGGAYSGVFQMAPVACLKPGPEASKYLRYINRDVSVPMKIRLTVLKGHLNEMDAYKADNDLTLDSAIHERIFLTENTKRIPVREGRIRGTLFIPEGEGPFPGVLDLFGGIGGLIEFRAAQFAARGFVSLALAYFDYEDLPKDITEFDMDYFEEAIKFLTKQEKVQKPHVAVVGVSKGGDLALSIGTLIPEVKAVVCINGLSVNVLKPLKTKTKTIPPLPFDLTKIKFVKADLVSTFDVAADPSTHPECQIPIEEADAHFLLLCSKDDKTVNIEKEHDRILSILERRGKDNCELIKYEGSGHLLEPPYAPFAQATFHPIFKINRLWGGNALQHTQASEDSWKRIQEFIRKYIN